MDDVKLETEHCPQGALPGMSDYWLAWANGVQSDGETEDEAISNARVALDRGEEVDPAYRH